MLFRKVSLAQGFYKKEINCWRLCFLQNADIFEFMSITVNIKYNSIFPFVHMVLGGDFVVQSPFIENQWFSVLIFIKKLFLKESEHARCATWNSQCKLHSKSYSSFSFIFFFHIKWSLTNSGVVREVVRGN